MATIAFGDSTANTVGDLPAQGSKAPSFTLVGADLSELSSADLTGRTVISIFPSIGTGVCQASVRKFNELASGLENTTVLNVSMDLPFALAGFCAAEGLENVSVASGFRSTFGQDYGITLTDSKFQGLYGRGVVVVDADGTVLHSELVPAVGQEPDYDAAIASLS
ncbi:thiol peroxidase [Nocardioides marmoriginsengisoli]|uniref:Thiol peroxidase n=1 Tax=Nocardioides marmoriginsengisoli TaxID=661483 RepID=A0A3N0CHU9_9ACTN|nr:thiol peroxidase [Nocardioides marmoriginsengisoli]RNL62990.1 thiol peroxidase [Nocardioides marmoriginsengisoli]